ncbi:heavy-metal-associated domain-containing protein [Sinisalibacter lacisalsi]|uniref:Heavy metal transport/detoxification protein n=1 Tax=Sinisalibacter lacisalsi TaxID=1526570 RepID=A0ABQ1Q9N3_9RHOB|nr:heavy-metal-associated domain-containing protein [Sinisalibacter lacisalsi]GGD20339.1 heavy metal transport/detoxification protein [Sinisalibacter lacisalsi]
MSRFSVPEMSCGHCKASIEGALLDADPGADVSFDMEAREVEVDAVLDESEIIAAIKTAGFEANALG